VWIPFGHFFFTGSLTSPVKFYGLFLLENFDGSLSLAFEDNQIAILSRKIQLPHQDPADRFIGATAIYYDLILATVDRNLISCPEIQTIS